MPKFWPSIPPDIQDWIHQQPVFFVASAPLTGKHINLSPKGHPSRTLAVLGPNQIAYVDATGSGCETISHIYENGRVTVMLCSFLKSPRILRLFCTGKVVERADPAFRGWIDRMCAAGMKLEEPDAASAGKVKEGADVNLEKGEGAGLVAARAVIILDVWKVQQSCGFGVPLLAIGQSGRLEESTGEATANGEAKGTGEHKGRSQNVYDPQGVQFDDSWDDRTTLTQWGAKKVIMGKIKGYRMKNNDHSLDGVPGLRMAQKDNKKLLIAVLVRAWIVRTFLGQWQAVVVGMLIALAFARANPKYFGVHTYEVLCDCAK